MTAANQFHVLILEESTPIADILNTYLSKKGHRFNNFKLSGKELHKLFQADFQKLEEKPLHSTQIKLFDGNQYIYVPNDDVLFIQASHVYVEVHLAGGKKIIQRGSLKNLLEQLPEEKFVQTHRSYAVNLEKVHTWNKTSVCVGETEIPVSRKQSKLIQELLGR